jgi:N-acetylglutamate synthase-like GNAT family acetyltransferase
MNGKILISRTNSLNIHIEDDLLSASMVEGFKPVQWLLEDWEKGKNRFSKPGEALYFALLESRQVGVCGVNRDPFAADDRVGRLRRLYVLPQFRRMGVGRMLVQQALADARQHFTVIRLRTLDENAGAFFEAIGFTRVEGDEGATHWLLLE